MSVSLVDASALGNADDSWCEVHRVVGVLPILYLPAVAPLIAPSPLGKLFAELATQQRLKGDQDFLLQDLHTVTANPGRLLPADSVEKVALPKRTLS